MRPVTVTAGPLTASSANNVALSQSLGSAGPLTINGSLATGGVATLSQPARIGIASAGNDSGITFTISGTNWSGDLISEVVTGANIGTSSSVLDYLTVTSIVGSGATASTVTVGTTGLGASPWIRFDDYAFAQIGLQFVVTGTVNYSFQQSYDDPNDITTFPTPIAPSAMTWDISGSPYVALTVTATGNLPAAPKFGRVQINSGTGSVKMTATQYGVAPL